MRLEVLLVTFVASLVMNGLLSRYSSALLDKPNHRSLHKVPTPRSGGIGIALAMMTGLAWASGSVSYWPPYIVGLGIAWLLVFLVSLLDDFRNQSAYTRLAIHAISAVIVCWTLELHYGWWIITVPGLVWATNLFNFMDGMDGLAGGQGLVGAVALAWLLGASGSAVDTLPALLLAGAILGFMPWNMPKASLFLGDSGSAPTGFLLASLALVGVSQGVFSPAVIALPFLPFVMDATLTLAHRASRGVVLSQAHREHLYQRLVLAGIPVLPVLLVEWSVMLAGGILAIYLEAQQVGTGVAWLVLAGAAGTLGFVIEWGRKRFPAD